jgi:hypothetical protein
VPWLKVGVLVKTSLPAVASRGVEELFLDGGRADQRQAVENGQQQQRERRGGEQPADDDDGERALDLGARPRGETAAARGPKAAMLAVISTGRRRRWRPAITSRAGQPSPRSWLK